MREPKSPRCSHKEKRFMISLEITTHPYPDLSRAETAFKTLLERKELGFLNLPYQDDLYDQTLKVTYEIKNNSQQLIVLGMGGSALGAQTLLSALSNTHLVEIWDSIDPFTFWPKLESLNNLDKIHWLVISKSGETIETLTLLSFVLQHYKNKGINWQKQISVITEKKSNPLYNWALQEEIRIIEFPLNVGGRFSVLTPVGLLPAAYAGIPIYELRKGALWALNSHQLLFELIMQSLISFENQKWITLFWFYSDKLICFGDWLRQLWAESLGKESSRNNQKAPRTSTPMICYGARDQHSVLQQVADGYSDKFLWFFKVKPQSPSDPTLIEIPFKNLEYLKNRKLDELLQFEAQATQLALKQKNVPSLTLTSKEISSQIMGAYLMLMELVIGSLGEALNINAFDQPGVELGKRLTREMFSRTPKL